MPPGTLPEVIDVAFVVAQIAGLGDGANLGAVSRRKKLRIKPPTSPNKPTVNVCSIPKCWATKPAILGMTTPPKISATPVGIPATEAISAAGTASVATGPDKSPRIAKAHADNPPSSKNKSILSAPVRASNSKKTGQSLLCTERISLRRDGELPPDLEEPV